MTGPRSRAYKKQHRNDLVGEHAHIPYITDPQGQTGWALPGRVTVPSFALAMHALTILDAEFRKALRHRA
jgi:hypothetical protein